MSFREVRADTTSRLSELRQIHRLISRNEANLPVPPEHAAVKGLFIVSLYAVVEFSLQQIIKATAEHINSCAVKSKHLTPDITTLVVAPKFMSAKDLIGEKQWLKRHEIATAHLETNECVIQETILGREVQNTRPSTIKLVFKLFGVAGNAFVDTATEGYLNEIGERRNAVAHGRESAAEVGGRFTAASLGERLVKVDEQITLMVISFEAMLARKAFIRPSCRRFYVEEAQAD